MKIDYSEINLAKIKRVKFRQNVGVFNAGEIYPVMRKGGYFFIAKDDFKMQAKSIKNNLLSRKLAVLC